MQNKSASNYGNLMTSAELLKKLDNAAKAGVTHVEYVVIGPVPTMVDEELLAEGEGADKGFMDSKKRIERRIAFEAKLGALQKAVAPHVVQFKARFVEHSSHEAELFLTPLLASFAPSVYAMAPESWGRRFKVADVVSSPAAAGANDGMP